MTQTVNTSATALADSDDLLARADSRTLCDLCSDEDSPVLQATLSDNDRMTAALMGATGMVELAASKGQRYTPADLAALTGASQALLKDIVCALALERLWRARPDRKYQPTEAITEAKELLVALSSGEYVLGFVESQEAGNVSHERQTATQVENRHGPAIAAERFFGRRTDRRHPSG